MSPRDVPAPDGALAWLEGSGRQSSRWLYAQDQVATLRTMGAYVLDVREVDGRRVVPGIMGYVDAAESMSVRADLDALESRLSALEELLAEREAQSERRDLTEGQTSRARRVLDEPVQRATR